MRNARCGFRRPGKRIAPIVCVGGARDKAGLPLVASCSGCPKRARNSKQRRTIRTVAKSRISGKILQSIEAELSRVRLGIPHPYMRVSCLPIFHF